MVRFHPHALERLKERGATKEEATSAIEEGEAFPAKYGRTGFRRNFLFQSKWRGKYYETKQVEVFAVKDNKYWLVITVIVKYY